MASIDKPHFPTAIYHKVLLKPIQKNKIEILKKVPVRMYLPIIKFSPTFFRHIAQGFFYFPSIYKIFV